MRANNCPYCNGNLLRHIGHGGVYWFCRSCWQQAPLPSIHSRVEHRNLFLSKRNP